MVTLILSLPFFSRAQESVAVAVLGAAPPPAEVDKPTFSITGSADIYYRLDFGGTKANNLTSFTNSHNSFALGMASIKFEQKTARFDFVADLGFGTRAKEFSYNDEGLLSSVKQFYVSYSLPNGLKFTAGTWATHVGYELLDPQLNRNYSMSYMFTNGPFHHTGVKAEYSKGKSGFMVGLSNATDYRIPPDDQINKKFLIAQYSVALTDNVKAYLNYVGGKNPDTSTTSQFDAVLTAKISDLFSIGYNGTINTSHGWENNKKSTKGKSWWGSAVYLNLDPKPWLGLTLRQEYFSDQDQLKMYALSASGGSVASTTLSANFKTGGFIFIPEFRVDNGTGSVFTNKSGEEKKTAASIVLSVIYAF